MVSPSLATAVVAESMTIQWGQSSGIPGSGWKLELGVLPNDPTNATLRFLVDGLPEVQRTFDLAATEAGACLLAKRLFLRPQVLRQLELHIEVAMIDSPYFPRERPRIGFHRLARESCHTV